MHIWMTMDPETRRVAMQPTDWQDGDFPPGPRGLGWPRREAEVDDDRWALLLAGELPPAEQDDLHREAWNGAGETKWPDL